MPLSEKLAAGEPAVGNWLSLSDPAVGEITAELGFDFAVIDMEHTTNSLETVADLARAVDAADREAESIVRLPWNDQVTIKRVLDVGVGGVMAPMIDDAEAAREFVAATRYPPEGIRGMAGGRAARYGLDMPEYVDRANGEILTIAQIETPTAVDNVEEITAVEGLDALFLGPADLSTNIGQYGDYDSEEFQEAVDAVLEAGHDAGLPVSTLAFGDDEIRRRVEQGFDFAMVGTDVSHVVTNSIRAKSTFEDAMADRES